MKTFKKILSVVFISITLIGCDQVEIINPDTSYIEKVVVRAELLAGYNFEGVTFTRTLPLDIAYSNSEAELKTVTAYLKINNTQIIPLHYSGNGLYKPLYYLSIKEGSTYELFAVYNNKSIYSKTKIPLIPKIKNVTYKSDEFYLQCEVTANIGEAYGAAWEISPQTKADDFYSIVTTNNSNILKVRTTVIPEQYRSNIQDLFTKIKVYAFDKAYYNYFNSKFNGRPVEDAFVHSSNNIIWNVEGENTIGLFIGLAKSNQ